MTSDDLGPFGRLVPMPLGFEASVRISRIYKAAFEALESFPRRREAIEALTGIDEAANWPVERIPELVGRATAVLLQDCVRTERITIYVFDAKSGRYFQLPRGGLVSEFISTTCIGGQETSERAARTSETSWAAGELYEIDCDPALLRLANARLPLLTSEAEGASVLAALSGLLDAEAGRADPPDSSGVDPKARAAWIDDLTRRQLWPVRETLLWIALRDVNTVADVVLTSIWDEMNERDPSGLGAAGVVWAQMHLQVWRRLVVEPDALGALSNALEVGSVRASGVFAGEMERRPIEPAHWEDLTLADAPKWAADGSFAHRREQVFGVPYTGHWTRVRFERDDVMAVFKPVARVESAAARLSEDGARAALRAEIDRCGGFLSQDNGAAHVASIDPTFGRVRARRLTKELTGNEKPGPKGPRRNRAA